MLKPVVAALLLCVSPGAYAQSGPDMTPNTVDVVEAASASGKFDKLLDAVMAADLAQTVATARNITVLAPIDPAFDAVPNLGALRQDKAKLANVLKYHVIPSAYLSSQIPAGRTKVRTLAGETLTIVNTNGSISIETPKGERAMVVQADIKADNGVVHAINKVLIP